MLKIREAVPVLVCLVSLWLAGPAAAQVVPPPPNPGIALVPSMTDSLAQDRDADGRVSCGDHVGYLVDFGPTTVSEDLDFRDVLLEISVPTAVATLVDGSLSTSNPDDTPQILSGTSSGDDRIAVRMGRVCRSPTCNSPAATVSFELRIRDPNSFTSLAVQGVVTGANFPDSVTNDPATSDPVDATVTTFPACAPEPLISSFLIDRLQTDVDGDGLADPGDVLRFTHTVGNAAFAETAAVNVSSTLPTRVGLEILPSTAQLTLGSITSATPSDLRIFVPRLDPGDTTTLTFDARIVAPDTLLNTQAQFRISGSNFPVELSDDADTSLAGDPTRTPIDRDPDPAVDLAVAPTIARPGNTLTYTAGISNLGTPTVPTARGVVLELTVPPATRFVPGASDPATCTPGTGPGSTCRLPVGSLAGGATTTRRFVLAVDAGVPATFEGVTTTASVADDGSEGPDPDLSNNSDTVEAATDRVTLGPDLALDKDDAGATATPGEIVTYDLSWSNQGNQAANRVEITDTVPDNTTFAAASSTSGWTCTPDASSGSTCRIGVGDLDVGSSGTVRLAVRVDPQLPAGVSAVTNAAEIAHDGTANDDLDPTDNTDTEMTPLSSSSGPDLSITKTAQTATAVPGETIRYEVAVRNQGTRGATGVRIVESVPDHTTFEAAGSDNRWSCSGAICSLDVPTLAAGAQETVDFVVRVEDTLPAGVASIGNSVRTEDDGANGDDLDPTDNDDTEDVPVDPAAGPDLGVVKTSTVASVSPGDVLVFQVTVTNSGTRGATGVVLTETVPGSTTFEAAGSDPAWDCPDGSPAGTICSGALGGLGAGEQQTLPFAVRVGSALPAGVDSIRNSVRVDDDGTNGDDPDPDDDTDTEDVPIDEAAPDLSVEKSSDGLTARPGDVVTYTVEYGNEGTREATEVRLLETVPDHTTFVAASSDPGWSCGGTAAGSPCELAVGNLPVGSSGTAVFAVRVDPELPAGVSSIANSVGIAHDEDDGDDPDPDDDDDTDDTPIDPSAGPDLEITKTDQGVIVRPGELVSYTLRVTSSGNRGASGVVVTETLPEHTRLADPAQVPANASWVCEGAGGAGDTCRVDLGELPVGDSEVLELTVRVDSSVPEGVTALLNTARVADDGTNGVDLDSSNNQAVESTPLDVTPEGGPDLGVVKSDGGQTVRPGEEIVYQITVHNDGTRPATGVVVRETVPQGTVYLSALSSPRWGCSDGAPAGSSCELPIASLDPGDVQAIPFAVRLDSETDPSQVVNTVSVTDDGRQGDDLDPTNNTDAETTPVRRPDETVDLGATLDDLITSDGDGDERADVGDVVTYVTQITNRGTSELTGVRYEIRPDPHTQLLGGSVAVDLSAEVLAGDEFRDGHVEVVLDGLAPGETGEIVFSVEVLGLPTAVRHLSAQGEVRLDQVEELVVLTDDPMTAAPDDPTRTPTDAEGIRPVDVPTSGQLAMLLMALGLGMAAFFYLRV